MVVLLAFVLMFVLLFVQVLCVAEQIKFTKRCEEILQQKGSKEGSLKDYLRELHQTLQSYTGLDLSSKIVLQLKVRSARSFETVSCEV